LQLGLDLDLCSSKLLKTVSPGLKPSSHTRMVCLPIRHQELGLLGVSNVQVRFSNKCSGALNFGGLRAVVLAVAVRARNTIHRSSCLFKFCSCLVDKLKTQWSLLQISP